MYPNAHYHMQNLRLKFNLCVEKQKEQIVLWGRMNLMA